MYPFEIFEALPADDFEISVEQLIRLQPMLSPTMHRLKAYWHWFFCPNRLIWKYWEEFISRGNGKKLDASQEYTPPEPPFINLYQMLRCSPYALRNDVHLQVFLDGIKELFLKQYYTSASEAADNFLSVLQTNYPWFIFSDNSFSQSGHSNTRQIFVWRRTPRLANALTIPDTCLPLVRIDANYERLDGDAFLASYLTETEQSQMLASEFDVVNYLKSIRISLMPFVACLQIYDDYYRDENLIDEHEDTLNYFKELQGEPDYADETVCGYLQDLFTLHYRAWEKDYFTTATQLPQKAPDVLIPGSDQLEVSVTNTVARTPGLADISVAAFHPGQKTTTFYGLEGHQSQTSSQTRPVYDIHTVNGANSTTVRDVRRAFALQRWFEKAVRTGTRYIESLKAFFNSDAGDARLQRPEFIGGSSSPIQISDTVQTSATADGSDTVQGNLAGYGVNSDNSPVVSYHAPEHGFVIGFFSILARTSYAQGIQRLFSRETWLDYAWPEFEHIGEQGVMQKELAAVPLSKDLLGGLRPGTGRDSLPTAPYNNWLDNPQSRVFGYQSRYSEYKQLPDRFGAGFTSSLDFWSLGRLFGVSPTLSKEFVEANISDRNFAVSNSDEENEQVQQNVSESYDNDQYIADFWVDCKKVTSLTLYSQPI